ncbi:MAG: PRC-barrel domain-containing protein [Halobacteriota archaeon]|nr:PRC-barrel domain-containing protein [Halobacteriota archaeon]
MIKVFTTRLIEKKVMSVEGSNIGTLGNITIDLRTGDLIDMVVKLDIEANKVGFRTEGQSAFMPFESVRAIKDYIVVDTKVV